MKQPMDVAEVSETAVAPSASIRLWRGRRGDEKMK